MRQIDPMRLPKSWREKYLRGEKISMPGPPAMRRVREEMDTDPEAAMAMDMYIDSFKGFYEAFEMMPKTTATAKHAMEEFDNFLNYVLQAHTMKLGYNPIKCTKGCSACCHINVNIGPREADLIASFIRSKNIRIDRKLVEAQANKLPEEYHVMPWEKKACPFLSAEDGSCRIYKFRPLACRKYLVGSDPKFCDTRTSDRDPHVLVDPTVEAFVAAFLTADGAASDSRENMPAMLLKRIPANDPVWI